MEESSTGRQASNTRWWYAVDQATYSLALMTIELPANVLGQLLEEKESEGLFDWVSPSLMCRLLGDSHKTNKTRVKSKKPRVTFQKTRRL
eukprot:COSAG06_NODE_306_length_17801_cov_6.989210_3_plen_90_part_00